MFRPRDGMRGHVELKAPEARFELHEGTIKARVAGMKLEGRMRSLRSRSVDGDESLLLLPRPDRGVYPGGVSPHPSERSNRPCPR